MKHIRNYQEWYRTHESEKGEPDDIADLKRLVDLGLAEPEELKRAYREGYSTIRREEFLTRLMQMFRQLGIEPEDLTTDRQRKNGTYFFQLTPAQVERILFEYPLPEGLTRRQESNLREMLDRLSEIREAMRTKDKIDTWGVSGPGGMRRSQIYQYLVLPRDMRGTSWDRTPSSSGFMKFNGDQDAEYLLARFIHQLALDSPNHL